jgi:uncharacterized protein (TIGR03437 family)
LVSPLGLLVDRRDTLYVGDAGNSRVAHFLKPSSVVHAANAQTGAPLARGGMGVFLGTDLTADEEKAGDGPLPLSLAGREIVVNDELRMPIAAAAPERIDFQAPAAAPLGPVRIAVRSMETGELVAGATAAIASTSPGLFTADNSARDFGQILNQDGSPNSPEKPAARGSTVRLFGTGQGPVSPPVPDGEAAPPEVLTVAVPTSDGPACLSRQPSVCVAIGSTFGEVTFSGLAAGKVGVWQLTVKIPMNAVTGNAVPVRAVINGAPSNIVNMAIQ